MGLAATRVRTAASTRQVPPWEARARVPERARRRSERPQRQLTPRTPVVHNFPNHLSLRHVTRGMEDHQPSTICFQAERIGWTASNRSSNNPVSTVWTWTSRTSALRVSSGAQRFV